METPQAALDYYAGRQLPSDTWFAKYAMRDVNGAALETSPPETHRRMARAVGATSKHDPVYICLTNQDLIPGGRILFALGNAHHLATLKNCYVLDINDDSLEGIFRAAYRAARTYSRGGGVGIALNPLRPNGSRVNNAAIFSSGSYSFSDIFSITTGTIGQHGRRGALMLQISVEHPDVELFIGMKDDVTPEWQAAAKRLGANAKNLQGATFEEWMDNRRTVRFANVSVQLTDAFMKAVDKGTSFQQRFVTKNGEVIERTVDARTLWDKVITHAYNSAEPGLVFWDTISRESPSNYYGDKYVVICTNPCGEQPLAADDACNLGAVHLGHFVTDSFKDNAKIDWEKFERAVRAGVRFLDKVNTIEDEQNRFPLPEMKEMNLDVRRIGLGVMGLAEMLIRLGVRYDTDEAISVVDQVFQFMCVTAYDESAELARQYGTFRIWDWEKHRHAPIISRLPKKLRDKIRRNGLRNITILTIAPTGTTSIIGETSGGIEPYYAFSYERRRFTGAKTVTHYHYERIVADWADAMGIAYAETDKIELPDYFVSAYTINWEQRVRVQAAAQKWIDSSISSTVNLPETVTPDEVKTIYMTAWKSGCKGITIYRKGSRKEVISDTPPPGEQKPAPITETKDKWPQKPDAVTNGPRLSFYAGNKHRVLINLEHNEDGDPIEMSLRQGKTDPDLDSLAQALGIVTSISLQHGVPADKLARALRGIQAGWRARVPFGGEKPVVVTSTPDAMALMLLRFGKPESEQTFVDIEGAEICPDCRMRAFVYENGCVSCKACGQSYCQ